MQNPIRVEADQKLFDEYYSTNQDRGAWLLTYPSPVFCSKVGQFYILRK